MNVNWKGKTVLPKKSLRACLLALVLMPILAADPALPPGETATIKALRDLKYADTPGKAGLVDLYLPRTPDATPRPVILWVHGGGNLNGSKDRCPAAPFVDAGFVVASMNYRLIPQGGLFPAQLEDCKGVVRWLRANAATYGIDPERIGAWGASAGGHHVSLLATTGGIESLEGMVGGNLDQSSRIQAACDWAGPTDISQFQSQMGPDNVYQGKPIDKSPIARWFGGIDKMTPERIALANPITHLTPDDPPILIMHGDKDNVVPVGQSQIFADALKAAGMKHELKVVTGAGHNMKMDERKAVLEFFRRTLLGGGESK